MDRKVIKKNYKKLKIKCKLYIPPHLRESNWNPLSDSVTGEVKRNEEKLCNNSHLLFQTYEDREVDSNSELSEKENEQDFAADTLRPKACSAAIKRLVSGALGLRAVISNEEKAIEQEMMRHWKDKRKQKVC